MPIENSSEISISRKDRNSFYEIYNQYYRILVIYGMHFLNDSQSEAEDMVQDVFSHIWEKELTFENTTHLKAYLYNSVRNSSLDFLKHRQIEEKYIDQLLTTIPTFHFDDNNDEEDIFSEEVYRELFASIERMPKRQREVLMMSMDGMSNSEIANVLNISIETVKSQKQNAKNFLRKSISKNAFLLFSLIIPITN